MGPRPNGPALRLPAPFIGDPLHAPAPLRPCLARSLVVAALSAGAGPAALAGTLSFDGSTVGGPLWARPLAGSPPTVVSPSLANNVAYQVTAFQVDQNDSFSLIATSGAPTGWDSFTFLYKDAFNASQPLSNVLLGNDRLSGGPDTQSGFTNVSLQAGVSYFFVVSGYSNNQAGAYTAVITAPTGTAFLTSAVPEPESAAMLLAGIGWLGVLAAKRRRGSLNPS